MADKSFFVKENGNDENDGLTRNTALKTLAKAVFLTTQGLIKTITVIGTLDEESETGGEMFHPLYSDHKSIL
jgi:hypothetical protein